jgi:O-antigen ligase
MEKAAFIIYLVVLVVSPLLFGGFHIYAYTLAFTGIFIASLLLIKSNIEKESGTYRFRWLRSSLNPMFIFFFVYLIVQMIPLPDFLLVHLSPEAKVIGDMSIPAVSTVDSATVKGHWYPLAPYTYPVRMSLVRWIAYGFLFFGLAQTLNTRKRIEIAVVVIVITGCFEALYGIMQTYSGSHRIWWYKHSADVSGTYINRNHFAGFMELGIVLAITGAGALFEKSARQYLSTRKRGVKAWLLTYLSRQDLFTKKFLIAYGGAIMGLGLILSASRGGIVSTAGALLLMGLLFLFRKDHRRKGFIILIVFLITSIYALFAGIDYTIGRFQMFDRDMDTRLRYTQNTMNLFEDYKLMGVGIGNFQKAFPKYQAAEDKNFFDFAHNDWAQFTAEAGTLGLLLLLTLIGYYIIMTLKQWRRQTDPFAVCLGMAPLAALTALGIHSYGDFNLHSPANFMALTAVIAIGHSALRYERYRDRELIQHRHHIWQLRGWRIGIPVMVITAILWSGIWTIRHFIAEAYCPTIPNLTLKLNYDPPMENINQAIVLDGGNADYRYKLAWRWMVIRNNDLISPNKDMVKWHERRTAIIPALEDAVRLNPLKAEYHMRLGWEYSYQYNQPDYQQRWLPAADVAMERAAYLTGVGALYPRMHVELANYWVMRSKTFAPDSPEQEVAWTKAVWHYRKARELIGGKHLDEEIAAYVRGHYPDEAHLKEILEN